MLPGRGGLEFVVDGNKLIERSQLGTAGVILKFVVTDAAVDVREPATADCMVAALLMLARGRLNRHDDVRCWQLVESLRSDSRLGAELVGAS